VNYNFDFWLLTVLLLKGVFILGQHDDKPWPKGVFELNATGKIGFLRPNIQGDNFINNGYDINNGFQISGEVFINNKITLGLLYNSFDGKVTNQSIVGTIDESTFGNLIISGSYNLLNQNSKFSIQPGLGFGYLWIGNKLSERRFSDSGISLNPFTELSFRINPRIGVYALLQRSWAFLFIDVADELKQNFNSTSIFSTSFGIKLYFF